MKYLWRFLLLWLPVFVTGQDPVRIQIENDSGELTHVQWVNPSSGEKIFIMEMNDTEQKQLNSFAGHTFEVLQVGDCVQDQSCATSSFVVGKQPMQAIVITPQFETVAVGGIESYHRQNELSNDPKENLQHCHEVAKDQLSRATTDQRKEGILEEYKTCMKHSLAPTLRSEADEVDFERALRETSATKMENFTCVDPNLDTSPDVLFKEWTSERDGKVRPVHVKLNRPASRIHVIEDFAYPEECQAMEETAAPNLRAASTADGKGGTEISLNRKALQAGITPDWRLEAEGDLVARLSRRVYDYVNFELDLNITEHGQEPLMSIQYFGRGYNDTTPDRYTPHCDGPCEGNPHPIGSRMATMVIYCSIPEKGGHTNFQNANVHIKPSVGSAIFFSYMDPVSKTMDHRFTSHSGCPVFEGEKKIVTQWVRYGVSQATPHYAFNTLGVLKRDDGDRA